MRLCFGTFVSILNCYHLNISKASFVSKIVNIIDPNSRYRGDSSKGDGPAINRLLSCKIDFVLSQRENTKIPSQDTVIKNFETEIGPYIDENKKAEIIIALLKIIQEDDYIEREKRETFQKYFGINKQQLLHKSEFIFSDFLGKILLYTTCGNVNNTIGKESIQTITSDFINDIASPYSYDYQWNVQMQTLTLPFVKAFDILDKALLKYQIREFIETVPPLICYENFFMEASNMKWTDKCFSFHTYIKTNIPDLFITGTESGKITGEIRQFIQTLNAYANFIRTTYPPLTLRSQHNNLHPPRWENYEKWAGYFYTKTKSYQNDLITVYQNIIKKMFFTCIPMSDCEYKNNDGMLV